MGLKGSKPKLSKEDLEFLKKNTNFTEEQIKEWYKGFVVSVSSEIYFKRLKGFLLKFKREFVSELKKKFFSKLLALNFLIL